MFILKKLGHQVHAVVNGREAVDILKSEIFDVVLMDCQMPEMDGYEATRLIRNKKSGVLDPSIPIIAMTAHAVKGDREKCLAAGMDDYISKPIQPEILRQAIQKHVHKKSEEQAGAVQTDKTDEQKNSLTPPEIEVFNYKELQHRIMGDTQLVETVLKGFLNDIPKQIDRLKKYFEDTDMVSLKRQSHTIKGAAANISAGRLRASALALEKAAETESREKVHGLIVRLEKSFDELRTSVNNQLSCTGKSH